MLYLTKIIARCLESIVINQTTYIEIICVNDYSTDNTAGIINSFQNKDVVKKMHP